MGAKGHLLAAGEPRELSKQVFLELAAKLHLKFSVLRQSPGDGLITAGNSCVRKVLRPSGVSLVIRIRNKPCHGNDSLLHDGARGS